MKADNGATIHWLVESADDLPLDEAWLSRSERRRYDTFKVEKRRREWLLGRWTAKRLLQSVARWDRPALFAVSIENDTTGAPFLRGNRESGIGNRARQTARLLPTPYSQVTLSISHSAELAFCALVAHPSWPLGADIERISPRAATFAADYFTRDELALWDANGSQSGQPYDTWVTAIWSAKEATLKALRLGLTVDTRAVSCLIPPPEQPAAVWMPFPLHLDENRLGPSVPALSGWWRVMDGYVLTLVARRGSRE